MLDKFLKLKPETVTEDNLITLNSYLLRASYMYNALGQSLIPDETYDLLFNLLKKAEVLNEEKGVTLPYAIGVTKKVGNTPVKSLERISHIHPMLSLRNVFNESEISAQFPDLGKNEILLNPKLDGLAVSLIYRAGQLTYALTRGDGSVGEDVSHNANHILTIPSDINQGHKGKYDLEVRGEVVIPRHAFKELNKKMVELGEKPYSNPRNAVSGILRSLNPEIDISKYLGFYAYGFRFIGNADPVLTDYGRTMAQIFGYLVTIGFAVKRHRRCNTIEQAMEFIQQMQDVRADYDIDIDGVVIQYNDLDVQKQLGESSTYPMYAVAYKFPAETGVTVLEDVEWQVGRTGVITPVAHVDDVLIGGVCYNAVTLHNLAEIKRLGIKINDCVIVSRQGDVIPKIVDYVLDARQKIEGLVEIEPPKECPVCGTATIVSSNGVFLYCMNSKDCGGRLTAAIQHFCSRDAMDIKGLGDRLIKRLIELNYLVDITDIYHLHEKRHELVELDDLGEKSIDRILSMIELTKKTDAYRVLFGLGIPGVGKSTAIEICDHFKISDLFSITKDELIALNDIGDVTADSIIDWFSIEDNQKIVTELFEVGVQPKIALVIGDQLKGQTFVITGAVDFAPNRDALAKVIKAHGGKVSGSVSKDITALICNYPTSSSKSVEAEKLGVPVWTERHLLSKLTNKIDFDQLLKAIK